MRTPDSHTPNHPGITESWPGLHVLPPIKEHLADECLCSEHIWRKHTPFYRCGFCPSRWSISTARGKVTQKKAQHWETCKGKRRGTPYFARYDEDGTELLGADQQRRFAETKSIRRNDDKLKALYEACGKPPPDSYCWSTTHTPGPAASGLNACSFSNSRTVLQTFRTTTNSSPVSSSFAQKATTDSKGDAPRPITCPGPRRKPLEVTTWSAAPTGSKIPTPAMCPCRGTAETRANSRLRMISTPTSPAGRTRGALAMHHLMLVRTRGTATMPPPRRALDISSTTARNSTNCITDVLTIALSIPRSLRSTMVRVPRLVTPRPYSGSLSLRTPKGL